MSAEDQLKSLKPLAIAEQMAAMQHTIDELIVLLREARSQVAYDNLYDDGWCWLCLSDTPEDGHDDDCVLGKLDAALNKYEGWQP